MPIATGQISILDYNDALTLTGFITSNHPRVQQYSPDSGTFTPDWTTTNLTLTASLYKLGSSDDIIGSAQVQNIKWFDAADSATPLATGGAYTVSGKTLKVSQNILRDKTAIDFICEITYRDTGTNLDLTHKMSITFSKVQNGGGLATAVAWMPEGNVFKNDQVATLVAECDLWRNGVIDNTNVSYQWYNQDPNTVTDQGGGVGWRKLTSTVNSGETGYTTRRLVVPADAVPNFEVYKCVITDTDSTSGTHNQKFQDTVTFLDQSDPIQVDVVSTGGNVFKNGVGSTELNARLFQAGKEIDTAGTKYTYKWYKYDQDGDLVTGFGGAVNYKTGKKITVGSDDVDVKATFICEIE